MTKTIVLFIPLIPNGFNSSCIDVFRFGNQEIGAWPVTAPTAVDGAGRGSTGPQSAPSKGQRAVKLSWPTPRMVPTWQTGRTPSSAMRPRIVLQDRIAKIGLPVSHHATRGNRPPDRNRSYAFGLPTNRPRSRAKTINTAPAPRANQYPVSRSETILIFISVLGSRYVDLPMKLVPAHPALS